MRPVYLLAIVLAGCGGTEGDLLSRWNLFSDARNQIPASGVIPYETVVTLFADHASKHRFLHIPPGARIHYDGEGDWTWPVGTVAVKTFSVPAPGGGERLVETRLWVNEAGKGFVPYVYRWNDDQTEAERIEAGASVHLTFTDETGWPRDIDYRIPNSNLCDRCHGTFQKAGSLHKDHLLGLRTRQLDRDHDYGSGPENQIDHLASLGLFDGPVPRAAERVHLVDPFGHAPIDDRVRSYFDANCNHCHNPQGSAAPSGLFLGANQPLTIGNCKIPVAAGNGTGGRPYDIVPGHPEESILVYRMESTVPDVKMPEIPSVLADDAGVELVYEWITGLPPAACTKP